MYWVSDTTGSSCTMSYAEIKARRNEEKENMTVLIEAVLRGTLTLFIIVHFIYTVNYTPKTRLLFSSN